MLPPYFGPLCEIVNALEALEQALPPTSWQYTLHALLHRFDALLDAMAEDALIRGAPVNRYEAPRPRRTRRKETPCP